MISISFGCTFLGDQCGEEFTYRYEVLLSPDTMMNVAMRQAVDNGWRFVKNDASRPLCTVHSDRVHGDVAVLRVFARLNQLPGVHGLVMVGVEECADGRPRVAIGASTAPEPAGLVRLNRSLTNQLLGMIQSAHYATGVQPPAPQVQA